MSKLFKKKQISTDFIEKFVDFPLFSFKIVAILDPYLKSSTSFDNIQTATDKKWVQIFRYLAEKSLPFEEMRKILEFMLIIPGTNTTTERVFSYINDIWTPEKGLMTICELN